MAKRKHQPSVSYMATAARNDLQLGKSFRRSFWDRDPKLRHDYQVIENVTFSYWKEDEFEFHFTNQPPEIEQLMNRMVEHIKAMKPKLDQIPQVLEYSRKMLATLRKVV